MSALDRLVERVQTEVGGLVSRPGYAPERADMEERLEERLDYAAQDGADGFVDTAAHLQEAFDEYGTESFYHGTNGAAVPDIVDDGGLRAGRDTDAATGELGAYEYVSGTTFPTVAMHYAREGGAPDPARLNGAVPTMLENAGMEPIDPDLTTADGRERLQEHVMAEADAEEPQDRVGRHLYQLARRADQLPADPDPVVVAYDHGHLDGTEPRNVPLSGREERDEVAAFPETLFGEVRSRRVDADGIGLYVPPERTDEYAELAGDVADVKRLDALALFHELFMETTGSYPEQGRLDYVSVWDDVDGTAAFDARPVAWDDAPTTVDVSR